MQDAPDLLNVWMETVRDYAIFLVDLTGKVASWNVGAERILGYQESEVIGMSLSVFFTPEDLERDVPKWEMDQALANGRASDDRWHVRKDGTRFWCSGLLMAARDAQGSLRGFVKVMRDLTERKKMEEQLRTRAEELLEADQRKNEFLAMLSHELRNPLAPILTSLYILKEKGPSEDPLFQQSRAMIERQVLNLKRMIDDLLDVSRVALNRIHLKRETVDLKVIAERAAEDVQPLMKERGHDLVVTPGSPPISLLADPVRLEQVIVNLLTNSAKFTDPGGTVWLTTEREGDQAVIRVRDTGIGIAPEMLNRAFDLFAQADQGLDRSRGGLGIGLTLTRNLIALHGGTIEARSDGERKGSEFIVRLPIQHSTASNPGESAAREEGANPSAPAVSIGRRVLIVDDNQDAAHSLQILLRHAGYEIQVAHDGPRALEVVRDFRPNVAVLDIGLPHLDGYGLARQLREVIACPLVALTGYAPEEAASSIFDRYLLKPVDPDELLKILGELVRAQDPS